jgi:nitrate/nitrite-specific signal transduction histidine kinase
VIRRRVFLLSAAAVGLSVHSQVADVNDAVNKAGRQRMLSQRISKAYLALVQKVETGSAQQVLDRSVAQFDRQLVELKAFAPAGEVRDTYTRLEASWSEFKGELLGTAPSKAHAGRILQLDAAILALANQGTVQYEKLAGKAVARLVNLAGRQRMLSQRMAKFYLATTLHVDTQAGMAEIAKARAEFVAAQEALRNAPEATARIKEELALADGQWVFFDQGLQKPEVGRQSPKALSEVFVASENLLTVMDRITTLYSGLNKAA